MLPSKLFQWRFNGAARRRLVAFALLCLGLASAPATAKPKWDRIAPADLAATECKSYPGSSAEVLFHRNVLDSSRNEDWSTQYIRIKIYSPKGAEESGVFYIDYYSWQRVRDLAARVTKPDGKSTEYGKENFNDSVVLKTEDAKLKRKVLAVPNLEAGDIVEMQWVQTVSTSTDSLVTSRFWYCQETVPVREYTFAVKASRSDFNIFSFNVAKTEGKNSGDYQAQLVMKDLPPFQKEPAMVPMKDVRGWFILLFSHPYMRWFSKPDEIWKLISTDKEESFRLMIRPGLIIKNKAREIIAGATTDDEKLTKLYDFCQAQVSNLTYFDSPELQKAKEQLEGEANRKQSPDDTLERKFGYPHHVNELFASLAVAAGYKVRLALCASRNNTLNVRNSKGWLFVNDELVAVQVGSQWRLYCPGDYYTPAGMIDRSNEFATYLRCEEEQAIFEQVPVSVAEKSAVKRQAHFQIDADGNLEGNVEISMAGHAGSSRKADWADKQQAEIDEDFRTALTDRLPGAEISDIAWENLRGNALPLIVRFTVKVPGYADVTGSKLVLTPDFFDHKKSPLLSAETRQFPIFFDYARAEHDDIEYRLPEGYVLESPSAPEDAGALDGPMGVRYRIGYKRRLGVLNYHRDYALGGNGAIAFQAAVYPKLKMLADAINHSDEHSLVLKPAPKPVTSPTPTPAPPANAPAPAAPATPTPASAPTTAAPAS
jgi:hypothetical protein